MTFSTVHKTWALLFALVLMTAGVATTARAIATSLAKAEFTMTLVDIDYGGASEAEVELIMATASQYSDAGQSGDAFAVADAIGEVLSDDPFGIGNGFHLMVHSYCSATDGSAWATSDARGTVTVRNNSAFDIRVYFDVRRSFIVSDANVSAPGDEARARIGAYSPTTPWLEIDHESISIFPGTGDWKIPGVIREEPFEYTMSVEVPAFSEDLHGIDLHADANARGSHSVPEPSVILLLGTGLAGLAGYGARRKKKA